MRSILDFGAVSNPEQSNTKAIQAALDAGPGRVVVPAGIFRTGTLYLRDDVELHLEKEALLKALVSPGEWNAPDAFPQNWWSEAEKWDHRHLILGLGIHNAAITGEGTIDGSGDFFYGNPVPTPPEATAWRQGLANTRDPDIGRPGPMVEFCECRNIHVKKITLRNSPCWTLLFYGCSNVEADGVVIRNPAFAVNSDGIDIDCCSDVEIRNADIDTGDDAIAIRGYSEHLADKSKVCERVSVVNCILASSSSVIRVGVGSSAIREIQFENLRFNRGNIGLHLMGSYADNGCFISDVCAKNLRLHDTVFPVVFAGSSKKNCGNISGVVIRNLYAESGREIKINRNQLNKLEHITLDDITIQ